VRKIVVQINDSLKKRNFWRRIIKLPITISGALVEYLIPTN